MDITWVNAGSVAAGIGALAHAVGESHIKDWATDIGDKGAEETRKVVQAGGMNKTKKGGPRIKTGEMIGSADSKVIKAGGGSAFVGAGFGVDAAAPLQTIFQEGGTRRGISAMLAIPEAATAMNVEAHNSGMKMLMKIQAEWNAI